MGGPKEGCGESQGGLACEKPQGGLMGGPKESPKEGGDLWGVLRRVWEVLLFYVVK